MAATTKRAKTGSKKRPRALVSVLTHEGWTLKKPTAALLRNLKERLGSDLGKYDTSLMYVLENGEGGGQLVGIKTPRTGLNTLFVLTAPARRQRVANFTVVQEEDGRVVGGNTFVLRATQP